MIITIQHARDAGLCVHGLRHWFERHDLDFRAFLRDGIDADLVLASGDAMVLRVVEYAQAQARRQRIGQEPV